MNRDIRINVNDRIRSREVRLVDENGVQMGVVDTRDALDLARQRGFDLIEVAPTASPPVCKLMDYGKYKYELGRRERDAHKKQKTTEVKGIRLRPGTDDHDLDVKLRRMLQFLKEGNKVKVTVIFRSREITHPEFARRSLEKLAESASEIAVLEKAPSFEGRTMTMVMAPRSATEAKPGAPAGAKKPASEQSKAPAQAKPAAADSPPAAEANQAVASDATAPADEAAAAAPPEAPATESAPAPDAAQTEAPVEETPSPAEAERQAEQSPAQ